MARYGKIETGFWHSKKIRRLSQDAKYLMLYVLSCPHGNAVGCFVLLDGYIAADLGWTPEAASRCVEELIEKDLIERDEDTSLLRIVGWWGHNQIENANVAKHVAKEIAALPACKVKNNLVDALFSLTGLHPSVVQTLSERLGKPFRSGFETVLEPLAEPSRNQEPNITLPNTSEPSAPAIAGAPPTDTSKPKKERGTTIDPNWRPNETDRQFARERGFTEAEINRIYPAFVDYWVGKAGANAAKRDWSATWRNWMRNESKQGKDRPVIAAATAAHIDWDRYVADYSASQGSRWSHRKLGPAPGYNGCRAPLPILAKYGFAECKADSASHSAEDAPSVRVVTKDAPIQPCFPY